MGKQTSARMMRAALAAGILAAGASPVLAVDYYVSPTGNNSNNGTSTSTPWQTIARVNQVDLNAGDRVFFQGSQSFSGTISITSEDGGTSSSPVVLMEQVALQLLLRPTQRALIFLMWAAFRCAI
jgi:hypothetical protein